MAPKHPQFPTDCLSPRWYRCRVPLVLNTRHWNEPPLSLLRKLVLFPELFRDPGICPSPNPVTSYTHTAVSRVSGLPYWWSRATTEQGSAAMLLGCYAKPSRAPSYLFPVLHTSTMSPS